MRELAAGHGITEATAILFHGVGSDGVSGHMAGEQTADRLGHRGVVTSIEVRTPGGASVAWSNDGGDRPVLRTAERIGSGSSRIGRGDSHVADSGGSVDSVRGIEIGSGRQF